MIKDLLSIQEDSSTFIGASITVSGWVKTGRLQAKGTFAFVHLSDGTTVKTLQIIIDKELGDLKSLVAVGTAISVRGLIVPSQGDNQRIELKVIYFILLILLLYYYYSLPLFIKNQFFYHKIKYSKINN